MNDKYLEDYCNYLDSEIGFLSESQLYDLDISYENYMNPDEKTLEKLELYRDCLKLNKK